MKFRNINIIHLLILSGLFMGCGKDLTIAENPNPGESQTGDPIVFRLQINNDDDQTDSQTRTAYGSLTNGYYPIYWRTGDQVEIICHTTSPARATVGVTVSGSKEGTTDLSNTGMTWNNPSQSCHFYAFYPASAVRGCSGSVVATGIPSIQTNKNGQCNMDYAYMAACADNVCYGEKVDFKFKPFMTTVTLKVSFPEAVNIQKLVLTSQDALTGAFSYDTQAHTCVVDPVKSSKVLAMHLMSGDNTPYITGKTVQATAFMLPQDIHGLTLTAVTAEGKYYSYTTNATLKSGHRYTFTINDMTQHCQKLGEDFSEWMTYLPDNVYLSQVSIPGSHDACTIYGSHYEYTSGMPDERYHYKWLQNLGFGWLNTTKIIKTQHCSLEEQLAAGVRMFDIRPSSSSSSVTDLPIHHGVSALGDPSLGGYSPGASGRQELQPFRISKVLRRFVDFLKEHPGETVLVHMKYENTSTSSNQTGWDKSIVQYIRQECEGYIADFSPTMTLADARGKILFMIREDYSSSNNGKFLGAYLEWPNDKVVFETTLHGNNTASAPIIVNDLYNLSNGASGGVTKYASIDRCVEYLNTDDVTRWSMNYVSCYDTAQCSVNIVSIVGVTGDYDYCSNKYNKYMADKLNATSFRANAGIVLMDFAGAAYAPMTYGSSYSNMAVYGDLLVKAVIENNNKRAMRCAE